MLELLREKNPEIEFFSINDAEFEPFGRVINGINPDEIIKTAEGI